jgi:hypothetical protein
MGGGEMFLKVHIFVGIRARNKSQKPVTLLSKTTSDGYPLKKFLPFWYVTSAIAI